MSKGIRTVLPAAIMAGAVLAASAVLAADTSATMTSETNDIAAYAASNDVPKPGIRVLLNQAKIVKLSHAAATVIIGNPEIADATVRDAQTLVLTGRGFGQTNLVILDAGGNPILDERIAVARENGAALRIYRQAEIETLSCEPYCEKAYLTEAEVQSIRAIAEANDTGN
jgi:Flp pilus assembly secretin CpaC